MRTSQVNWETNNPARRDQIREASVQASEIAHLVVPFAVGPAVSRTIVAARVVAAIRNPIACARENANHDSKVPEKVSTEGQGTGQDRAPRMSATTRRTASRMPALSSPDTAQHHEMRAKR